MNDKHLKFTAQCLEGLSILPSGEQSINFFFPIHFKPLDKAVLNSTMYDGTPISIKSRTGDLRISDAGLEYQIRYFFPHSVEIRLYQWASFIRLAAFWYKGRKKRISPTTPKNYTARGEFKILNMGNEQ